MNTDEENKSKRIKPASEDPVKEALSHPNGPSLTEMIDGKEDDKPSPRADAKDVPEPDIPII
jgi:hypothetical protein